MTVGWGGPGPRQSIGPTIADTPVAGSNRSRTSCAPGVAPATRSAIASDCGHSLRGDSRAVRLPHAATASAQAARHDGRRAADDEEVTREILATDKWPARRLPVIARTPVIPVGRSSPDLHTNTNGDRK